MNDRDATEPEPLPPREAPEEDAPTDVEPDPGERTGYTGGSVADAIRQAQQR